MVSAKIARVFGVIAFRNASGFCESTNFTVAAQLGQRVMEELVGAAVEVVGRYDLVAHLRDVQQGQRGRRLPGRHGQRAGAAFDRGDALLEHVGGRVHDARVDVPELLEGKQVGRVVGVLEDERGGLVDRAPPARRWSDQAPGRHAAPAC